jgi:hypothetical protein
LSRILVEDPFVTPGASINVVLDQIAIVFQVLQLVELALTTVHLAGHTNRLRNASSIVHGIEAEPAGQIAYEK